MGTRIQSNDQTASVRILVVEDEILLARDIALRLNTMGYEVAGIAATVIAALELLKKDATIDMVLIDIVLKGAQDGIDLARSINTHYHIPFIFLTAHADRETVHRAKRVNPYAYILKPFNDRQVGVAIELALLNFSKKTPEKEILKSQQFDAKDNQVLQIKDSLFLKKDHHFKRVPLKDILFIQAESNYSTIYTATGKYVYAVVLKKIEQQLPSNTFLRTHRSYMININTVDGYEGNTLFIGNTKIPVSKPHKEEVFRLFRTL